MNITQRPVTQKPPKAKPNPKHLARVRELPCCICYEWSLPQMSPTTAHHPIHGRGKNTKVADELAIPLCDGHHQGTFDRSKVALHREPTKWKQLYGNDIEWVSWVEARLD